MKETLKNAQVFLIGGSGGVGKTTVAASLGVKLAEMGYKTVVLTVDPARRLAQALGFQSFSGELQKVELPNAPQATLFASMLDAERDFDRVIKRFAKTQVQQDKILNSRIYRVMVESLGGSHEYAAMERLLEFVSEQQFEKIVVDTPPSHNALDLFNAPQRLADFMDNSVLKWFQGSAPKFLGLFRQGTKIAMKALQTIFGGEFLQQLGEVLEDLEGMQAGFRKRNLEVLDLLKSKKTAFFLVSTATEARLQEAQHFHTILEGMGIPLSRLILNRLEPKVPDAPLEWNGIAKDDQTKVSELLQYHHRIHELQSTVVSQFRNALPSIPTHLIARRYAPVHEIQELSLLGDSLLEDVF